MPTEQTLCEKTCVSSIKHLLFEWSLVEQSVWGAEVSLLRRECFHFSQRRSSDVTLDGRQITEKLVYGDINMVKLMITVSSGSYQQTRWSAVTEELLFKSDCRRAPTSLWDVQALFKHKEKNSFCSDRFSTSAFDLQRSVFQIRPPVSAVERSLGVFMLIKWDSVETDPFFIFTRGFLLRSLFCSQFSFTELRLYKSDLFCYVLPPHIPRKSLSLMCATNKYHLKIIEEQDASELNRLPSV